MSPKNWTHGEISLVVVAVGLHVSEQCKTYVSEQCKTHVSEQGVIVFVSCAPAAVAFVGSMPGKW